MQERPGPISKNSIGKINGKKIGRRCVECEKKSQRKGVKTGTARG